MESSCSSRYYRSIVAIGTGRALHTSSYLTEGLKCHHCANQLPKYLLTDIVFLHHHVGSSVISLQSRLKDLAL